MYWRNRTACVTTTQQQGAGKGDDDVIRGHEDVRGQMTSAEVSTHSEYPAVTQWVFRMWDRIHDHYIDVRHAPVNSRSCFGEREFTLLGPRALAKTEKGENKMI